MNLVFKIYKSFFFQRVLFLMIVCSAVWSACKQKNNNGESLPPEVNVVQAGKESFPVYSEYVGQTYGLSDVTIEPRIQGWITGIHFTEGSLVKKGSLLYTIDDAPMLTQVDAARADVARTQTMMVNYRSDLNRVKPLAEMNALSQRDLDAATAAYESSLNEVKIAEARLANARIQLGYTKIIAPITGIIGISKVQVGDYIGNAAFGNGINAISSVGEIRVRFPISENDYLIYARQDANNPQKNPFVTVPVELILSDGSVYGEKGRLQLTNRQIDPATGSILVQAVFDNKKGILRPGQYVKVRFQTSEYSDVIVVPQQAVNQLQNIYQVYLLSDSNKIKPKNITVGRRVGGNWIVTSGVQANDKLVIAGSTYLNPSMVLKPKLLTWNYDSTSKN